MNVNFWWIRHGPTYANAFIGHTDIAADLSDTAALERLALFLPKDAPLLSSDLIRTTTTADAIHRGQSRGTARPGLREIYFGAWEGKTFSEVAISDPETSKQFWENPGDTAPSNGESWNSFSNRIHREIQGILAQNSSEDIIAVAHFGVILSVLQLATGMPPKSLFSFKVNNLSVTKVSYDTDNQAWSVHFVNQNV